ncbi:MULTISPECIES: hypothetical protein [unclassified Haladaptatus]|uniref:hypothetical protein n=1 Tax=unclassified Haladaptatus TaxID=2622732 RepID=UPI00209C4CEA|nr:MULTISPECIES: hypothetical protein [unclassified Haladaptatus]MCO8246684.1 hypothetical protein [Haladaptatus sp. AB643]MCO8256332.1 hypothetical protein [Haladaptatus sp. AB618]
MLESTNRTPLGGIGVVATAGALVFAQRELGLLAGLTLFALWAFLPAVYAFVGGQVAVVALFPPHVLGWTVLVAEFGLAVVLLSPSLQGSRSRERLAVVSLVACCLALTWLGLLEFGMLVVIAVLLFVTGAIAMIATQYGRGVVGGAFR